MSDRVALLLTFVGVGALMYGIAIPLIRRRIKPNGLYGLRVPATFKDESVWYDANEAAGRDMRWVAIICVVLAVAGFFAPIRDEVFALGMAFVLVVTAISSAIVGWRRANRMLRERQTATPPASG